MTWIKFLTGCFALALPATPNFSTLAAIAATPAFEAVDVHPSPTRLHPQIHGHFEKDRVVLRSATLIDLISSAYHVEPTDIVGGPAWLAYDRFDINAKAAAGTRFSNQDDDPQAMVMLRSLLSDRFGLIVKVEKRPLPAFVLSAGKATKLKPAADTATPQGCHFSQDSPSGTPEPGSPPPPIKLSCTDIGMDGLADLLHEVGSPYFNRPVVDQTGLKGKWDVELRWNYNKPSNGGGIPLPEALDKQLGLKVESKPVPTQVVVVEAVNEKPTPNIDGIEKILPPPPPAQFDVAVVRKADPVEKNFNVDIEGLRVNVKFATLLTLIYQSFDVNPGSIENKPKWLNDQHWDIIGTAASDSSTPLAPGQESGIEIEEVHEMLRSLLADRFKLATHTGSRPSTVYALLTDNPKMKKASGSEQSECMEGPGPDGKDPRVDNPARNRLIYCQNVTMTEFASELHRLAPGFVPAPVVDSTNLPGSYDFLLSFSKAGFVKNAAAGSTGDSAAGEASDPGGTGAGPISLFDAVQKQLGLKLEKRSSVPTPSLVIDHIEENPTDN